MNKLNSSNSFQVYVLDEFQTIMFVAQISYNKESVFRNAVKPHITKVELVELGTGNAGKNLEYEQTTDGLEIDYIVFAEIMSKDICDGIAKTVGTSTYSGAGAYSYEAT